MRLLFTYIFYLGLLCPASVFATPIRTTPDPTEGHSTGDTRTPSGLHSEGQKYLVEARVRHIRPERGEGDLLTEKTASLLRDGLEFQLPQILPVLDARQNNHRLDPKTVPDKRNTFRVTKVSFEGSFTHIPQSFRDQANIEPFREIIPPPSNRGMIVNRDVYWLDITVLHPDRSKRAELVICWINPQIFDDNGPFEGMVHYGALMGQVGYGNGNVKDLLALVISPFEMTLPDGTSINLPWAMDWAFTSTSEPHHELLGPNYVVDVFTFH
ncbi:hypothetical protein FB446DRAFT_714173 [Lentinula raphanica]|nr:hypothetical protein FB446DRAFT_714173 [Lentinula raphanica]